MASTSVASPSLPPKKYDVFISFRGEDTRCDFTSHLHGALCRNKIETYIDYRIEKGHEVWAELEKAIKDSSVFLVIFSENYASSTWCLNELVEIMDCKKRGEAYVIPVFYKVDPSHVRKQSRSYRTAFAKHKKQSVERIQKWKDALFQAANLSGFHSRVYRTELDLIEEIIKEVSQKLNLKDTHELRGLFIPDKNFSDIVSLLRSIDSSEVQIIGLWGMGGIGKTTLAAAIFHKFSSQYESCCFLEKVAEESKRHGFNHMCNRLLSKLLGRDLHIDTSKVIPSLVMRRLRRTKSFVVLDDVNTSELLENLVGAGRDWLGAGSRVIVTARDKHVLDKGVDKIYEVKEMNFQSSLRLFSLNAFNKNHPKQGYEEVSKRAIVYAKGIPLALKVLGSFLHSKSENEWDNALNKLKKTPNVEIQNVLKMSYDELDDDEKNIFLDIACFLKGRSRGSITKILNACGFFADIGIRDLLDKALITITSSYCIEMHDLIQEMGKEIVRKESIQNPEQRSRLWDPQEVFDVLTYNKGTSAIQALLLDMTQISGINLSPKAFKKMPNIRLLAFETLNGHSKRTNVVHLPMGLHSLPKSLRYLAWDGYPLKFLPLTFCPEKLVNISLTNSNVEKLWQGVQDLPNLEKINLEGSKQLMECPNLSTALNLKYVNIKECESLLYIDPSIFSLPKLETLDVSGCASLMSLGSNTCSQSLRGLYLEGSGLNELPPSILLMIRNIELSLSINDGIVDLPENFASDIFVCGSRKNECDTLITLHKAFSSFGFQSLKFLRLDDCQSLCEIPDNISLLSSLQDLSISNCDIISLPESMKYLPRLKSLLVMDCIMLQWVPELPQSIQFFRVWNCQSLQTVLSSNSELSRRTKRTFMFTNCISLDEHSYDAILKDAIVGIELKAKPLSIVILENEEDSSSDDEDSYLSEAVRSGKLCYFLPTGNGKFRDWFHYHSTQTFVTIELPPKILGFIFYLVVSQLQSYHIGCYGSFGCECHLETGLGERTNITSFFVDENALLNPKSLFKFLSDHVFIWYDAECCMKIVKAINDRSTTHSPKLTFKFFGQTEDDEEVEMKECGLEIKECGFRWIYPSEDQIVEEEERCKFKRKRTVHELENNVVQNRVNGSEEFDKQEETFPPTKKMKQRVIGTSSNLEVDETENLRLLLEELLHIGFGRDLGQPQPELAASRLPHSQRLVPNQPQSQGLEQMQPQNLDCLSYKDSCTPIVSLNFPEGEHSCHLFLSTPTYRMVANGKVCNLLGTTLHNNSMLKNHVRVTIGIVQANEENTSLPVPNENACLMTLRDAIGAYVAWPANLVSLQNQAPISRGKGKEIGHSKGSVTSPIKKPISQPFHSAGLKKLPHCTFLEYCVQNSHDTMQFRIPMSAEIFNTEFVDSIGVEQINEIIQHTLLSASTICLYIRFIYDNYLHESELSMRFSFISPHMINVYIKEKNKLGDILYQNKEQGKLIMIPYNTGGHWVLIAINILEETIYYLDSMYVHHEYHEEMTKIFNAAIYIYRKRQGLISNPSASIKVKWLRIKCPRQTNSVDCGYYVLRFIKEIVHNGQTRIPENYFNNYRCPHYRKEQLDEIKEEWSAYLFSNFIQSS